MSSGWPKVALGELVRHRKEFIFIDDMAVYKRPRVRLHAEGIVSRDTIPGAEIKTKKQQVCRTGDLLVAEIDAKVGGYGIVPKELDGSIVSSHYFLYDVDESKLSREYLGFFLRTKSFGEQVGAQGSTNYAAIRPDDVLRYKIPLPPLPTQRRLVAWLNAISARSQEALVIGDSMNGEIAVLLDAALRRMAQEGQGGNWQSARLGDFIIDARYGLSEKASEEPEGVPILRMGNIQGGRLQLNDLRYLADCDDVTVSRMRVLPGDILVNRTNSAELVGKCAVFEASGIYLFASYLIRLRLDARRVNPWFVAMYINSSFGREYMLTEKRQMTGQANINLPKLRAMPLHLPPFSGQSQMVRLLNDLGAAASRARKVRQEIRAATAGLDRVCLALALGDAK